MVNQTAPTIQICRLVGNPFKVTEHLRCRRRGSDGKEIGDTPGWLRECLFLECNPGVFADFFAAPEGGRLLNRSNFEGFNGGIGLLESFPALDFRFA